MVSYVNLKRSAVFEQIVHDDFIKMNFTLSPICQSTGSNTELTQKYERVKVQVTYVPTYIYKQISPIVNSTPLYSVSL